MSDNYSKQLTRLMENTFSAGTGPACNRRGNCATFRVFPEP